MNNNSFIDWLLEEMNERKLTQADLARVSGVTNAQISRIITGDRKPGVETLLGIASAFNLAPEDVFQKAGILPKSSPKDLSPKKRELMEKLQTADDATVKMVIEILEAAVRNQQRTIPSNINPKTTPR